jgi:hypothetical protein
MYYGNKNYIKLFRNIIEAFNERNFYFYEQIQLLCLQLVVNNAKNVVPIILGIAIFSPTECIEMTTICNNNSLQTIIKIFGIPN